MTNSYIIQDNILSRISSSFCKDHLNMTTVPPGTNVEDGPGMATSIPDYVKEGKTQEHFPGYLVFESICQASSIPLRIPRYDRQSTALLGMTSFISRSPGCNFKWTGYFYRPIQAELSITFKHSSLITLSNHRPRTTQANVTKAEKELERPLKKEHILAAF